MRRATFELGLGDLTIYDGNLHGVVLRNKMIVDAKQRQRIISSPNELINNVLVLQTTLTYSHFYMAIFLILTHAIEWLSHKSIALHRWSNTLLSQPFNRMHQKEKDRIKNRLCKRAFRMTCMNSRRDEIYF